MKENIEEVQNKKYIKDINEAIKVYEEFRRFKNDDFIESIDPDFFFNLTDVILSDHKRVLKENEKLKKQNYDLLRKLKNRVKEVRKLEKYSMYKKEFSTLNKKVNELQKENKELKKENRKLNEYIMLAPNLDEMTAIKYKNIQEEAYIKGRVEEQQKAEQIIYEHYIPKQKVKDKIEEIEKAYEESKDEYGETPYYYPNYTIEILQDLLESEKK